MDFISLIVIVGIAAVLITSIIDFIRGGKLRERMHMRERRFSAEIFYTLLMLYLIVILGFGFIYFMLSMNDVLLVEDGELREVSVIGSMIHSFYFSGVTMLTVGYGDITPIGIGRLIALVQALIGYILPTAFVLKLVQNNQENRDREKDML
ncbi:potassium channel family protein [Lentibacillus sp. CBA3610]|uniref:potassium channel family protein n=1 Tax=Lentibacillus sp. CBA3610 TaxID=2518176 RepID=UPI001595DCBD|nr:potassium channel family protein [Lentibacillus sp. CBA3610]QKY68266.1 two pore domain potassium channel family protein [Lentibacillus sp. CBA3610]